VKLEMKTPIMSNILMTKIIHYGEIKYTSFKHILDSLESKSKSNNNL